MGDTILSPLPCTKEGGEWNTPTRSRVCTLVLEGKSDHKIVKETGIPRSSVQRICKEKSSHRSRKGKVYKPRMMTVCEICQCIRHISRDWSTCRLSFVQVKAQLGVKASVRTIRQELCCAGYRRCIVYPRPYISHKQAKKRLDFALSHRW
jgi:transposase